MPDPVKATGLRSLEIVSPLTAVVFAALGWLVFSRLFDTADRNALPALTQSFLAMQPWWLGAGLLAGGLSAIARVEGMAPSWKQASAVCSGLLALLSTINIGWGIVAMYLLTLPPAGL